MDNPFSWDYLTAPLRQTPTFGPFSTTFFTLFVLTFVFSLIIYLSLGHRIKTNPVLERALSVATQWMMWLCAAGIFVFSFRLMRVSFLNLYMRIWTYLFFAAFVASVIYFVWWLRTVYPTKMEALEKNKVRQQYLGQTRGRARRARRRSI
jgi:magnesium-transporting ATPase (P-type)